jgi:2-hydroxychromene-2-carboxylate isomerase
MSLQSLLMPAITQRLFSRERLLAQRAKFESRRAASAAPHQVHYFHQVDDPYSALVAQCLPLFLQRYAVELCPHIVSAPVAAAAPERDKLVDYSRKDAVRLAHHFGLNYAARCQPATARQEQAMRMLVAATDDGQFVDRVSRVSLALWSDGADGTTGSRLREATHEVVAAHLRASDALRQKWGHYLGATLYYGGEWYWGVDRLYHLEQRLQVLGVQRAGVAGAKFPPSVDLDAPVAVSHAAPIDFFFSLRSPYSAIVARRVFDLGRMTGAPVRLRYLLPMVMRGLPVPKAKRQYIAHDTAREAFVRQIPFGRMNDPVGRPTERGLSIMPLAERAGRGQDYVLSFMRGVWAEGLDAGSDRGLRKIVERAGLSWDAARSALKDNAWRALAETNRAEMFGLGLWGVPSFRVGETAVWGQDRLWAVQEALLRNAAPAAKWQS